MRLRSVRIEAAARAEARATPAPMPASFQSNPSATFAAGSDWLVASSDGLLLKPRLISLATGRDEPAAACVFAGDPVRPALISLATGPACCGFPVRPALISLATGRELAPPVATGAAIAAVTTARISF